MPDHEQGEGVSVRGCSSPELPVHGVVLCEHMRSLDWQVRKAAYVGRMPEAILAQIREVVAAIAGIPRQRSVGGGS